MYVEESDSRPTRWNDHALDSMGRALQSMQGLTRAASSGGFAVNEAGGQALLNAVRTFRAELDGQRANLTKIKQSPQLGGSLGAICVAKHARRAAADDPRSLEVAIEKASRALDAFESGIHKAMANYRETDAANRRVLHGAYRG
jgi:hypothetical protein